MKIQEITLFTNQIKKQKHFYQNVLEFDLVYNSEKKITFKTGSSLLSFRFKSDTKPAHFAFNIPLNKIEEALSWLQKRVAILPDNENEISNLKSWHAKAIYFYDADKNIVEFISRQDLRIESSEVFSSKSVNSISEIALVTAKISKLFKTIYTLKPIDIFHGNFNRFCALGNHEGLFILLDKTVKTWHPTSEAAHTADFIIKGDYNFNFIDGEVSLV